MINEHLYDRAMHMGRWMEKNSVSNIMKNPLIPPTAKCIYSVVYNKANNHKPYVTSYKQLAQYFNCDTKEIHKLLSNLKNIHLIRYKLDNSKLEIKIPIRFIYEFTM